MIERYGNSFEDIMVDVVDEVEENENVECLGISYSECPLIKDKDGDFIRVEKNSVDDKLIETASATTKKSAQGSKSTAGYFSLVTSLYRYTSYENKSKKTYKYYITTSGIWSKNSFQGNANYTDAGEDYIMQAVPSSLVITSDRLYTKYNRTGGLRYGTNGKEYRKCDGGDSFIQYAVQDDPSYYGQLTDVSLHVEAVGKSKSKTRKINSYYVHTWKQLSVSVGASVGEDEASLSITPSINNKSWQLYSYVTFEF